MSLADIPSSGANPGAGGSPLPGKKLVSWKEIAGHLGRETRTVQRWEKTEGLPVRRHGHQKKSTVYAYASELDAWFKKRQPADDPEADAALTAVSRELTEAITDPLLNAWFTAQGDEIGDLCNIMYGQNTWDGNKADQMWNGHSMKFRWNTATTPNLPPKSGGCVQVGP